MISQKVLLSGLLASMLIVIAPDANAQAAGNLLNMFANAQTSFDAVIKLIKFSGYVIGLFLIFGSIFKFSQLGSNPQLTAKVPISMFFTGVGVFAVIGTTGILTNTLSLGANGPGNILVNDDMNVSGTKITQEALTAVLTFIRLLGYVAVIRGWLILNDYAQGKGQASISKGLTHLVGGVLAINVSITAKIFANTFAPGVPVPFG